MLTVVTGPPCAGKTTYVQQHRMADDITIDFDQIAQALGSAIDHGHNDHIAAVAAEARHAAIHEAITWHKRGRRTWIIDASPGPARLRQYQAAGARIVALTADRAELHRRADAAGRPPQWHGRIDHWLDTGGQPASPASPGGRVAASPRPQARPAW